MLQRRIPAHGEWPQWAERDQPATSACPDDQFVHGSDKDLPLP
jgi:hypothetical protein